MYNNHPNNITFTIERQINSSGLRKRNFLRGSKATNCSTMGISWRQFITNDQQVAGELRATDGKQRMNARASDLKRTPIKDPPSAAVRARNSKHTPTLQFSRTIRKSERTQMTRGNPSRLDGIISASLFPFRVLLKSRLTHSPRHRVQPSLSHSVHSWLYIWMDSDCAFSSRISNSTSFRKKAGWHLVVSFESAANPCYDFFWLGMLVIESVNILAVLS